VNSDDFNLMGDEVSTKQRQAHVRRGLYASEDTALEIKAKKTSEFNVA
jgi:hypothetical protein